MRTAVASHMALDVYAARLLDVQNEDAQLVRTGNELPNALWEVIY